MADEATDPESAGLVSRAPVEGRSRPHLSAAERTRRALRGVWGIRDHPCWLSGRHVVCRVADEVLVDLMSAAGGIDYAEAAKSVVLREVQGVSIPFASPQLLWRMKQHTRREKDRPDLLFLRQLFEADGITPPE